MEGNLEKESEELKRKTIENKSWVLLVLVGIVGSILANSIIGFYNPLSSIIIQWYYFYIILLSIGTLFILNYFYKKVIGMPSYIRHAIKIYNKNPKTTWKMLANTIALRMEEELKNLKYSRVNSYTAFFSYHKKLYFRCGRLNRSEPLEILFYEKEDKIDFDISDLINFNKHATKVIDDVLTYLVEHNDIERYERVSKDMYISSFWPWPFGKDKKIED